MFEVGNYEFAKCAIDRRTETEARVIRFPDRAPAAVRPINGNHVVDVTHRRQIENQRRAAHNAQGRRGEYGAFEAVRRVVTDNKAWRVTRFALFLLVVRQVIQVLLNFFRTRQLTKQPEFAFLQCVHLAVILCRWCPL